MPEPLAGRRVRVQWPLERPGAVDLPPSMTAIEAIRPDWRGRELLASCSLAPVELRSTTTIRHRQRTKKRSRIGIRCPHLLLPRYHLVRLPVRGGFRARRRRRAGRPGARLRLLMRAHSAAFARVVLLKTSPLPLIRRSASRCQGDQFGGEVTPTVGADVRDVEICSACVHQSEAWFFNRVLVAPLHQ